MKKVVLSFIIIFLLFITVGCDKKSNDTVKKNTKDTSDLGKNDNLTEEEKIWISANDDEIYNERIFIRDSIMISSTKDEAGSASFSGDLDKLRSMTSDNLFAKKFIELYEKTNLDEILNSGTDTEKYLLYTYLNIMTNHNEGFGTTYNAIKSLDEYPILDGYNIDSILYSNFNNDARFIFKYVSSNTDDTIYLSTLASVNGLESSFYMYKYDYDTLIKKIDNWKNQGNIYTDLDKDTMNKVITNNSEFLNFYINYKNSVYYPRYDKENKLTPGGDIARYTNEKVSPRIGMTSDDVLNSSWGNPDKKNVTNTKYGKHEQWVYTHNRYVYIDNGIVTAIQMNEE